MLQQSPATDNSGANCSRC